MITEYKIEVDFINNKMPTVKVEWIERPLIIEVMTPLLPKDESDRVYKSCEVFKPRAGLRWPQLVKQVCPDPSKGLYRIAISIKLLRELFAAELMGWGGGGKGFRKVATSPLSTRLTRGR